ncbi:hypothetical protein QYH69_32870 [Paraburkholderia sp. SARCC-3016]|jgi:hypothetical protein|uniref:hypothetical protein n=1 Tax=Paraburkholderia sp. SARCC-3016 TaxID=3058611 RepID=UPI002806BE4A|nr:hypothetical protein [Paraburkholderia sp. SARCC-3016]MDQ7982019.1 hypothetical protein [Paraburkholderia sp. SARCC-3016]
MEGIWKFQLRVSVSASLAAALRGDPSCAAHAALHDVLKRHGASMMCQYDAFAEYVEEAQRFGPEKYPLYEWTRDTIENPEKKAKYLETFTVYVGDEAIYDQQVADSLEAQLSGLVDREAIRSIARFDTNPANNPQPPSAGR